MSGRRHWGIVGGGMLGLTLALRLSRAGERVTVLEAAPALGGLAGAWRLGDVVWDRHYHVTLLSDVRLRGLLAELGLERDMQWVETRTGCYAGGTLYPVSNVLEFLRFPPLGTIDTLRLGATILYGSKVRNWRRLEQIPVERWLTTWSGRRTFARFWRPLLRAKLGESYRDASAAFIWATIQRLYSARRTGLKKEMFGYVPGGYASILERFGERLAASGVEVRVNASVTTIDRSDSGVCVRERSGGTHTFDDVVVTASAGIAARLIAGLETHERCALESIRYQGIVCASLLLERPLSPYYLTYITDEAPFTAVVEMSALVDRRQFGGRSLVYLPKYCSEDDSIAQMSDAEIERMFLDALERMYPHFSRAEVAGFRVSRVRDVFAIPTLGYSTRVPPLDTSVPGVHIVTSAQIVNGTLNVNETVGLAERAVEPLLGRDPARASTVGQLEAPPRHVRLDGARPAATLSLDLDDLWSYLKTRGDASWRTFPSFLDLVVPRALDLLGDRGLRSTWFVVGRDAAEPGHGELLRRIANAGHEVGNHSYLHEPWLHRYSPERLDHELALAERAIEDTVGRRPTGFRGPGFSVSRNVLNALQQRGYLYDASTLPTFFGPLARAFYMRDAGLTSEERAERGELFGSLRDGLRPIRPYRWHLDGGSLVEVPVTTMPVLRTPIHMSYLMFLGERSPRLALGYLSTALRMCRWTGVPPSLLLHSHDFVDAEEVPAMAFFPGFRRSRAIKMQLVEQCVDLLRRDFDVLPIESYVSRLGVLPGVEPRFSRSGELAQCPQGVTGSGARP